MEVEKQTDQESGQLNYLRRNLLGPTEDTATQPQEGEAPSQLGYARRVINQSKENPEVRETTGFFPWVGREAERFALRGSAMAIGAPGDIREMTNAADQYTPEQWQLMTGRKEQPSKIKTEDLPFGLDKIAQQINRLPTSAEVNAEILEKNPHLKPEGRFEEGLDRIYRNIWDIAGPKTKLAKSVGMATAGGLTAEGLKSAGFGEGAQALGNIATSTIFGTLGKGNGLKALEDKFYKESRDAIPPNARLAYDDNAISKIAHEASKGHADAEKSKVLSLIGSINEKLEDVNQVNKRMTVEDAVEFSRDIKKAIRQSADPNQKRLLGKLLEVNEKALFQYGKRNPKFIEALKKGNQVFQGRKVGFQVKDFLKRNLKNFGDFKDAGLILGAAHFMLPGTAALKLGALGPAATAAYGVEILRRMAKYPEIRKHYASVVSASLKKNTVAAGRAVAALDHSVKESLKEEPWRDMSKAQQADEHAGEAEE